jgi:L-seryl-tRNA(Ser) seleniumtransferase
MEDRESRDADLLRGIPQVERLASALDPETPHVLRVAAARVVIDEVRSEVLAGGTPPSFEQLSSRASGWLEASLLRRLRKVVNATGVLLHTNLGRAPLAPEALEEVGLTAAGYSNLEYDLETASRGSRYVHAVGPLLRLTGAEDAVVVNNNASAVLLALTVLAGGRDVIISRGELIEIGGGFRIPEILATSGARLVEVGTTNRTHLRDYERAITDETAAIMKVHPSNYRVLGFTSGVSSADLATLAHDRGLHFIHDLGSGLIRRRIGGPIGGVQPPWLRDEPAASDAVGEGADVVTFSGDKLLGGPQCGIILATREVIARLGRHPLLRAMRVDKMTLAALEATLTFYLEERETELPLWKMALADPAEVEDRASRLAASLQGVAAKIEVNPGFSATGGGSGAGAGIPTFVLEVAPLDTSAQEVFSRLVASEPPVLARISEDRVVIDLRTVSPDADGHISAALRDVL